MKCKSRIKRLFSGFYGVLLISLFTSYIHAQVVIGDVVEPDPSAILELKSQGTKGMLLPRVKLDSINDTKTVPNPAHSLLVYNIKSSMTTRASSIGNWVVEDVFYYWDEKEKKWIGLIGRTDRSVSIVLASLGVSRPALFILNGTSRLWQYDPYNNWPNMKGQVDPLNGTNPGDSRSLPLTENFNYTDSTVVMNNGTITFKPGIYNIVFSYEFVTAKHATGGSVTPRTCTQPMYYIDFPMNVKLDNGIIQKGFVRKYASAAFYFFNYPDEDNSYLDHGGTVELLTIILEDTSWEFKLGRGYGGNCENLTSEYKGFAMPNRSTYLYIERLSDLDKIED